MSHVFHRATNPITAVRAEGCWITDKDGNRYLDAAGGAIVTNIGHGSRRVREVITQGMDLDYIHPSVFTSDALEAYASDLAKVVPIPDVRIFPTSGGAESVETAIKLARSYHLARGDSDRSIVISRRQSYHGNTLGALGVSGRVPLRAPYEPWLGTPVQAPEVCEYRCPNPDHPSECAAWHARELDALIGSLGPHRVAAFIGEAVGGATLGVAAPPAGYWEKIAEVCRRYGLLLIVDEIMTGFGRTGHWFGIGMADISPDIIVSGKGAAGGYWPLGICMASGSVQQAVMQAGGFVHGYTFSHSPTGAAVAHAVLEEIIESNLVEAAATKGKRLLSDLKASIGESPVVGDVRGVGLLIGIEFVVDRETKQPFARSERFAESVAGMARQSGLLVYPSSGCADGITGDCILLGPPLTITDHELDLVVEQLSTVITKAAT